MHFSFLDAYFHLASQGDKEAYNLLYQTYCNMAESLIASSGYTIPKNRGFSIEFYDYLDSMFFKTINDYDRSKGTFTTYSDYVLKVRLLPKMYDLIQEKQTSSVLIGVDDAENINAMCATSDNDETMRREISRNEFKMYLCSPTKSVTRAKRLSKRITLLLYAGYTRREICKILGLTEMKLRQQLKKLKKDNDVCNFKLEMK